MICIYREISKVTVWDKILKFPIFGVDSSLGVCIEDFFYYLKYHINYSPYFIYVASDVIRFILVSILALSTSHKFVLKCFQQISLSQLTVSFDVNFFRWKAKTLRCLLAFSVFKVHWHCIFYLSYVIAYLMFKGQSTLSAEFQVYWYQMSHFHHVIRNKVPNTLSLLTSGSQLVFSSDFTFDLTR